MADFSALKTSIQNYIKQNGNEEITGNLLQQILLSMVSTLGDSAINDLVTALNAEIANRGNADTTLQGNIDNEATARGNADTELGGRITTLHGVINGIVANVENGYVYAGIATPSTTPVSGKLFYLALTAGTYTNFGSIVVPQGINILKYNGSAWSLDSFIGLDDAPTQGSNNLVKSGGVLDSIIKDGSAFDLSAYNNGTTYADLSAALTALNALPAAYKKGGMSFKYVQTSDNKYVQYRLTSDTFNTTPSNWQGVDDEPTAGSNNLVKSGGTAYTINRISRREAYINKLGNEVSGFSWSQDFMYSLLDVSEGDNLEIIGAAGATDLYPILFFNDDKSNLLPITAIQDVYKITVEAGYTHCACNFFNDSDYLIRVNNDIYGCVGFVVDKISGNVSKISTKLDNTTDSISAISKSLSYNYSAINPSQTYTDKYIGTNGNLGDASGYDVKVFDVSNCNIIELPSFIQDGTGILSVAFYNLGSGGSIGQSSFVKGYAVNDAQFGVFNVIDFNTIAVSSKSNYIEDYVVNKAIPKNQMEEIENDILESFKNTGIGLLQENVLSASSIQSEKYMDSEGNLNNASGFSVYIYDCSLLSHIGLNKFVKNGSNILYAAFYQSSVDSSHLVKGYNVNTDNDMLFTVPNNANLFCICTTTVRIQQCTVFGFNPLHQLFNSNWKGKTALFYGDSIIAIGQSGDVVDGEMIYPYDITDMDINWQRRLCNILGIQKYYARGIGGIGWTHSEGVAYMNTAKGYLVSYSPSLDYDDAPEIEGCTKVHSGMSDFDRIQASIPENIRESIDLIFMFNHNTTISSFTPNFLTENVKDTAWLNYEGNPFGGDYNIDDPANAILSTIMKLQIWCPNAVIVIGTPMSGLGTQGQNTTDLSVALARQQTVNYTKEICQVMSIPCINVWASDGINPLNRTKYITDGIHPYSVAGSKALARTIICGLYNIYPNI